MISFIVNEKELRFEHSLVSLSEWEAEHEKPFFSFDDKETKSMDEMISYFECMLVSPRKHKHLIRLLDDSQMLDLSQYIQKGRTATTVKQIQNKVGPRENVTSELIYYWLVEFRIPFEPTDRWHLNRLLMLVKVCSAKKTPPPKQTRTSRSQQIQDMRRANEERRAKLGTRG